MDVGSPHQAQISAALEPDRPVVGAVLEFDLLETRRGAVSLDAAGHAPRLEDERASTGRRAADRARELNIAVEPRHAALDPNREIGFGRERLGDRSDREAQLGAGLVANAAALHAIRVVLPGNDERTLAFDRPRERTQFAAKVAVPVHRPALAC